MKKIILLIALLLSCSLSLFAQNGGPGPVAAPRYMGKRAADPAACSEGSWYYNTTSHLFKYCSAANTWTSLTGGAGGMSVGSAVSGGGVNRVLFEDGSQNLSTSTAFTFGAAANQLFLNPSGATDIPFKIKLAGTPSGDAVDVFASDGTTKLFGVDSSGTLLTGLSSSIGDTSIRDVGANTGLTFNTNYIAGIVNNGNNVLLASNNLEFGSGMVFDWNTGGPGAGGTGDIGIARDAAGILRISDGNSAGVGSLKMSDLMLRDDTNPSHFLILTDAEDLTANHTISLNSNNADRTVSLSGNLTVPSAATVSGTNTGDQTITLTGNVTGSGTGSFAATIANSAVTYAKIQNISATQNVLGRNTAGAGVAEEVTASQVLDWRSNTQGQILYRGASTWDGLATGTAGQVLQTGGASANPSWVNPPGGLCTNFNVSGSDATTTGTSLVDITGLVTGTLALSSNYTFNAILYVTTTAVTTGTEYGTNITVAPTRTAANYIGPTTVASNVQTMQTTGTNANNIATPAFLTTASEEGVVQVSGFFTTAGSGTPVFSLRHLKVTSGTSTVKIGSQLTVCKQ